MSDWDLASGAGALTLISSTILAADTASPFTFSSIPQGYSDLEVRAVIRSSRPAQETDSVTVQFNGDTGAHYDAYGFRLVGTSAPANSNNQGGTSIVNNMLAPAANATAGIAAYFHMVIPAYAATTFQKTGELRIQYSDTATLGTDSEIVYGDFVWRSTAAINAISIALANGPDFIAGSEFRLYGIK